MNSLNIVIPEGSPIATEVESWEDGVMYVLKVKQTSPGNFEVIEAMPEKEEEQGEPDEADGSSMSSSEPNSNPAIEAAIAAQK